MLDTKRLSLLLDAVRLISSLNAVGFELIAQRREKTLELNIHSWTWPCIVLTLILMGNLKVWLGDPCYEREEDLATVLVGRGIVNITYHVMPRQQYKVAGIWTWIMQREVRQVTGRG